MSKPEITIELANKDENSGCDCGGDCCGDQEELEMDPVVKRISDSKPYMVTDLDDFEESHVQLVNKTDLEFIDISSEKFREYHFPNGDTLRIEKPLKLHVSDSGGHRVFTADSICWYIRPSESWAIKWVSKENKSDFVK